MGALLRHSSFVIRHSALFLCITVILSSCTRLKSGAVDDPSVRALLTRYFDTWSKQDMSGYGACFHEQARILFIAADGRIVSQGTTDFLHSQKLAHEQSTTPMKEVPLEMKMQGDAKVMQAEVTWVLTKGSTEQRGTDFFTLKRDGDSWKIVGLVFYGE